MSSNYNFTPKFGEWIVLDHETLPNQKAVLLTGDPVFRQLFEWLSQKDITDTGRNISTWDEARAVTAFCYRYGSYFDALTKGKDYSEFHNNSSLSRISQSEIKRINLETSAAMAFLLKMKADHPMEYRRIILKGLRYLPMPWSENKTPMPMVKLDKARAALEDLTDINPFKLDTRDLNRLLTYPVEGNAITYTSFRSHGFGSLLIDDLYDSSEEEFPALQRPDSGLEYFHRGKGSTGCKVPGYRRIQPEELNELMWKTLRHIEFWLDMKERSTKEDTLYARNIIAACPNNWDVQVETSTIEFAGEKGVSIEDNLPKEGYALYPF